MLKALIRINLTAMVSSLFRGSKNRKKRGLVFKILVGIAALYVIGTFALMFGMLFQSIIKPMIELNIGWLYFGMAAIIATALCFIGSVFTAKTLLFDAKDNDLLLSMPIPPGRLLASRMITLLIMNYFFEFLVMAPAGFVYYTFSPANFTGILFFVIGFLFLPFFALSITCIFGWFLAIISARVRNKTFITTALSLGFLAAYFYFYSKANSYIQVIIQNAVEIGEKVKKSVFPLYHFGTAIVEQNIVNMLLFLLCILVPFAIVYIILSRAFVKVATTKKGFRKAKYKDEAMKVSSARVALLKKELKRFSSSAIYMLNAALGVVFTLVGAVALLIYRDLPNTLIKDAPQLLPFINPLAIVALCFLASTNIISAPSISLEGKSLWIAQSLPVDGGDVLLSKAHMHIVISLPSVLIASVACILVLDFSPAHKLFAIVLPSLVTVFCALFGVVINLHFPRFDWVNETVAVKQSMSTMIAMFASMAIVIAPVILYGSLLYDIMMMELFMLICTVVFAILCVLMVRYLKTKGRDIFASLG
jgi:ABC-2 type transport system permease protein